jgi:hypothetical protein
MKIYNKLVGIAEKLAVQSKDNKVKYFSRYKNDLYERDAFTLMKEAEPGDTYIWSLKDNGCGTFLERCNNEPNAYVENSGHNNKFFLINCNGNGNGSIKEISRHEALNAYINYPAEKNKPRLIKNMYEALNEKLGLIYKEPGLEITKLASEFSPKKGDKSVIRVTNPDKSLKLDVVRVKMALANDHEILCQKSNETYYVGKYSDSTNEIFDKGPIYLMIDSEDYGFAKVTETTDVIFELAEKCIYEKDLDESGMTP